MATTISDLANRLARGATEIADERTRAARGRSLPAKPKAPAAAPRPAAPRPAAPFGMSDLFRGATQAAQVASPAGAGAALMQMLQGPPKATPSQAEQLKELEEGGPSFGAASNAMSPDPFLAIDPDTGDVLTQGDPSGTTMETPAADEAKAAKAKAKAEARSARERALEAVKVGKVKPMTREEYDALTPRERAAVDFNGMLTKAVAADRANQPQYQARTQDQQATYDELVKNTFGSTDRGSDLYAPETMELLRQLDFKDTVGDLDDFLELKTAITADDLAGFATPAAGSSIRSVEESLASRPDEVRERFGLQSKLAVQVEKLPEELMAKGSQILQSFNATARQERSTGISLMGGTPKDVRALGFQPPKWSENASGEPVPADVNTYFQAAFDKLSTAKQEQDYSGILSSMQEDLTPKEFEQFFRYADSRTTTSARIGAPLGESTEGQKYRSVEEFRELLGLSK